MKITEYRRGYNDAIKEADVTRLYPYNVISEAEGDEYEYEITLKQFEKCLAERLTNRECQVIQLRFRQNLSLDDTGKKFGVTRERIRQIEAKAIRKLRHYLRGYQVVPLSQFVDLTHQYQSLQAQYEELSQKYADRYHEPAPEPVALSPHIDTLDLSVRSYNCLMRAGYQYVDQIKNAPIEDLMNIRNMGKKSLNEILTKVGRAA